jgi:hypothetical protein
MAFSETTKLEILRNAGGVFSILICEAILAVPGVRVGDRTIES